MTRPGLPEGWNERHKDTGGPPLPAGVEFYSTPGHGFLRVDTRLHAVTLTSYDYMDGYYALLEEDCSAPAWLDQYNRAHDATQVIHDDGIADGGAPYTDEEMKIIEAEGDGILSGLAQAIANKTGKSISIEPAGIHAKPARVVIEPGVHETIDGQRYQIPMRIYAETPSQYNERTGHAPDIDGHLEAAYEERTHVED